MRSTGRLFFTADAIALTTSRRSCTARKSGSPSRKLRKLPPAVCAQIEGGVVLNVGSAVIMPEVFLKALTVARNLGHKVEKFTTATLDMTRHYRPSENVQRRPTALGGRGVYLIGHHELMLPLLFAAVAEAVGLF